MTDKVLPIINSIVSKIDNLSSIKKCRIYSVDTVNKVGQNTPQAFIRLNSLSGEQSNGRYECLMLVDCIIITTSKINSRIEDHLGYINDIKGVILGDPKLSDTACNTPRYDVDLGIDGISTDKSSAGMDNTTTITTITFEVIFYEVI